MASTQLSARDQVAILCEGAEHVETRSELEERIAAKGRLTVKFGIDPTGSELHLGHAVVLHKMQQFVELGHRVILLIGDFTARIGDPSGRSETRPRLTDEEIAANMRDYREQAGKVLDLDRVEMMYNSTWLGKLSFTEFIALASRTTVAQMLARNDFAERYRDGAPIAMHEFFYPIAVAYDSVVMQADVELGGSDQLFNLLIGRDYQEYAGQRKQICLATPILEGTDGVIRMGKSRGNYIGLTEPPQDQFGKLMSLPDAMIPRYVALAAFRSEAAVRELSDALRSGSVHPMAAKKELAAEIVARYHGAEAARAARERFEATIQRGELPPDVPELTAGDWKTVTDALLAAGFSSSRREAERLVAGGGVKVDGVPVADGRQPWTAREPVVLSVGTRRFVRVIPRKGNE
jgi:tyrosyl-tRNA synthetase